jgi:hypothetical protein
MACRAISESLSRLAVVRADCSSVESDFVDAVVDRVAALTERSHNRPRRPKCNPLSRRSRPRETVAGLTTFLKNNSKAQLAWQEIVDFSYRAPGRRSLTEATPDHPRRRVILSRALSLTGIGGSFGDAPAAASVS